MVSKTKLDKYSPGILTQLLNITSNISKYLPIRKNFNSCVKNSKKKYKKHKNSHNMINKKYKKVKNCYKTWTTQKTFY